MTKPKVFIVIKIPKEIEEYIGKYCDYTIWDRDEPLTYDIAVEKIKDVEGALLPMIKIDENLLDHGPNLKVISNFTVGYNNFDTDIMKERGIIGTNAAGSSNNTVALVPIIPLSFIISVSKLLYPTE